MANKNLKNRISKALLVLMLMAIAVGGTLAYLTDRDSEVNVFTLGNVELDLIEDFQQESPLKPAVDVKKEACIKNIGKSDAWVWMTVAVPAELDADNTKMLYWESPAVINGDAEMQAEITTTVIEGSAYHVYTLLYKNVLKAGETTSLGLNKVYLDSQVDYRNGQYYWVAGGAATPIDYDIATTKVYVSGYAIQQAGFDNVEVAYKAFQEQWKDKEIDN